ncbi:MAG: cbb3-type cytochrome c oxidase subunit II [Chloroflexi bacterium]|uniref:Cbb3-type cytochrome c oxidase subunit II n=1 Tax=Candidatus Chlorohelix allophototropha TaxID=3003348 RepID=A0A8T7M220_9CHLR|nr:cbb3-type cytochrome c oxidase subunit II [Chloroflexota bacterium]WJW67762.1 cbb3-type cytochrome c oxidase subunit II [Chloroflexota bacterium L227-S17]
MHLRMSFGTVFAGAVLMVMTSVFMTVGLSSLSFQPAPSDIARPLTAQEARGRQIYISNGCVYCHTQYVRPQDWNAAGGGKASRVAQAGDYVFLQTMLLGSERTGPDLSQEGGIHPDDWHKAHFKNPRYTSPQSIMPQFSFIKDQELDDLIAYVQSLGGKAADARVSQMRAQQDEVLKGWYTSYETHLAQIKEMVPPTWRDLKSAMTPTTRSLLHGKQIFLSNCVGCHGQNGNGRGPASSSMKPDPADFTRVELQVSASDGQFYQYLLFGLPGTSMPAWGDFLTVNDIWDTINFLRTIPKGGLTLPDSELKPEMMLNYDPRYGGEGAGKYPGPQPSNPDKALDNPYCYITPAASATQTAGCEKLVQK